MVIADLTYIESIDKIEHYLEAHRAFLDKYYKKGVFILSGRKNPRTGGMIISNLDTVSEMEKIIQEDPFFKQGLAVYRCIQLEPTRYADGIEKYLGDHYA